MVGKTLLIGRIKLCQCLQKWDLFLFIYIHTYFFLVYASAKIRLGYSSVTLDWNSFWRSSNLIFMHLYSPCIFTDFYSLKLNNFSWKHRSREGKWLKSINNKIVRRCCLGPSNKLVPKIPKWPLIPDWLDLWIVIFDLWIVPFDLCLVLLQVQNYFLPIQIFWASPKIWPHLVLLQKLLCRH